MNLNPRLMLIAASVLMSALMPPAQNPAAAAPIQPLVISPQPVQANPPTGPTGFPILYSFPESNEFGSFDVAITNPNDFSVVAEIFPNPLAVEAGPGLDPSDVVIAQTIGAGINPLFFNDSSGHGALPANSTTIIAINLTLPNEFDDCPQHCDHGLTRIDILGLSAQNSGQGNAGPYDATGEAIFDVEVFDVPEPSTWMMMLVGFAGLGFLAYRDTKNRTASGVA